MAVVVPLGNDESDGLAAVGVSDSHLREAGVAAGEGVASWHVTDHEWLFGDGLSVV